MATATTNGINKKAFPRIRQPVDLGTSNYLIPIIEDIDSNIAGIKEQVSALNKDVNNIKLDISKLDGEVKAMNERIDKNLAEYKAIVSDMNGEMRANSARLEGKIEAVNARLDTLQNKFSWNLAWVGIIMGLVLAIVQHFWK